MLPSILFAKVLSCDQWNVYDPLNIVSYFHIPLPLLVGGDPGLLGIISCYLGEDDFWCKIFGCTTEGPCATFDLLGKTKVSYFHVALLINEKVFRLQVSARNMEGKRRIKMKRKYFMVINQIL